MADDAARRVVDAARLQAGATELLRLRWKPKRLEARRRTAEIISGALKVFEYRLAARIECPHCLALLDETHQKYRSTICCAKGKVKIELPPAVSDMPEGPAKEILKIWEDRGPEGKTLRTHARAINNALALASQKVNTVYSLPPIIYYLLLGLLAVHNKEIGIFCLVTSSRPQVHNFPGASGYSPTLVMSGRMYHMIGPLQPGDGQVPHFLQSYIHDPHYDTLEGQPAVTREIIPSSQHKHLAPARFKRTSLTCWAKATYKQK
jgi:hypothetical protein